ncbi:MAG: FtsX-like permease family protein [Bifidobacteriaceae bacterium]|jgi:putative ABC transport system permease protein|nr:FtsX-like permease family protein [Bifidobacteriaceae bacterium]
MFRYTLMQLRSSLRHLVAAGLAIMIATAFLTAGLSASGVVKKTTIQMVSADFAQADLVVPSMWWYGGIDVADVVRDLPGVEAAFAPASTTAVVSNGDTSQYVTLGQSAPVASLEAWPVDQGREAEQTGEAVLGTSVADRLGIGLGDTFTMTFERWQTTDGQEHPATVTLVGLFDDSQPFIWSVTQARATLPTMVEAGVSTDPTSSNGSALWAENLLVKAQPGVDTGVDSELRRELAAVLGQYLADQEAADRLAHPDWYDGQDTFDYDESVAYYQADLSSFIQTRDQAAEERAASYLGSEVVLTLIGLVFAGLSLLVASLVIANTFQVLIASRTRTLALLRCVGATKDQVRQSVLMESLLVGLGASVLGLLLGIGLVQAGLAAAGHRFPAVPVPHFVGLPVWLMFLAVAAGTGTTLLAALAPARLATRVAPVEALRPQGAPVVRAGAGRGRWLASIILTLAGVALLAGAVWYQMNHPDPDYSASINATVAGLTGSAIAAIGILIGAVFWLPRVVGWLTRPLRRFGAGARLAAVNSVRHPRRTAATATALLIGVTLVSAMTVAAASVAKTLERETYTYWPIDLQVGSIDLNLWLDDDAYTQACGPDAEVWGGASYPMWPALTDNEITAVRNIDGLTATAVAYSATVTVPDAAGIPVSVTAAAVDPEALRGVLAEPEVADLLADGIVLMDGNLAAALDNAEWFCPYAVYEQPSLDRNSQIQRTVTGDAGQIEATLKYLPVMDQIGAYLLMSQETLQTLAAEAQPEAVWAALAQGANPVDVADEAQDTVTELARSDSDIRPVYGAAISRADTLRAIDAMLLIGLALLAVSVLVALIGVANTLSLSVIERRKETAVLRALGLTRGQTRWMMAVEGMVIAGVAGLSGLVVGTVYGWGGVGLVIGYSDAFTLALPVDRLLLILALAVAAGLVASVLPGRRAAKTPPAAALATE